MNKSISRTCLLYMTNSFLNIMSFFNNNKNMYINDE